MLARLKSMESEWDLGGTALRTDSPVSRRPGLRSEGQLGFREELFGLLCSWQKMSACFLGHTEMVQEEKA
jgi:hypothetical protein